MEISPYIEQEIKIKQFLYVYITEKKNLFKRHFFQRSELTFEVVSACYHFSIANFDSGVLVYSGMKLIIYNNVLEDKIECLRQNECLRPLIMIRL